MKVWINAENRIIQRPDYIPTLGIHNPTDEQLAKVMVKQVEAPDVDKKYWLPFDGTKISAMTKEQQDAVDAACAKAVEESAKAEKEAIYKAEAARLADRERITKREPAKAIGELFDMIRSPIK